MKKTWPKYKKGQFKTLVYGLARKTGYKEMVIKNASLLDKKVGNFYQEKAPSVAAAMLREFKFYKNKIIYRTSTKNGIV